MAFSQLRVFLEILHPTYGKKTITKMISPVATNVSLKTSN